MLITKLPNKFDYLGYKNFRLKNLLSISKINEI